MATQLNLLPQPEAIQHAQQVLNAAEIKFDGSDYDVKRDELRLTGQILRVFNCMKDGEWRTIHEIAWYTRDPEPSISSQLRHLRKQRHGGHTVEKRHRGEPSNGLWEYRLIVNRGGSDAQ